MDLYSIDVQKTSKRDKIQGRIQEILIGGPRVSVPENVKYTKIVHSLAVFGVGMGGGRGADVGCGWLPSNWGVWGASSGKKNEISGFEKYILVDPGDDFAMNNGESKKSPQV